MARLRGAGAILIATTNVAQLLAFPETDNPVYGRTSNPQNHDRSSSGSSGGEGVFSAPAPRRSGSGPTWRKYTALGHRPAPHFRGLLEGDKVDRRVKRLISLSRLPPSVDQSAAWVRGRLGQRSLADAPRPFRSPLDEGACESSSLELAGFESPRPPNSTGNRRSALPTAALPAIHHGASYDSVSRVPLPPSTTH